MYSDIDSSMDTNENRDNGTQILQTNPTKLNNLTKLNNPTNLTKYKILTYDELINQREILNNQEILNQNKLRKLENIENLNKLNLLKIPEKYRSANWAKSTADANEIKNLNILKNFSEHFSIARQSGSGLMLLGDVGTGKTYASICVLKKIMSLGFTGNYTTAKLMIFELWNKSEEFSAKEVRDRYVCPDLLIVDELGRQGSNDAVREQLFDILDERTSNNRSTIFVGNVTVSQAIESLGKASYSRALSGGMVLSFEGRDRRLTREYSHD